MYNPSYKPDTIEKYKKIFSFFVIQQMICLVAHEAILLSGQAEIVSL
jgi:hypothetical protein